MLRAENDRDRTGLLPYNRSTWMKQKVRETFAGRKPSKTNLYFRLRSFCKGSELTRETHSKLLFAISSMFAFYNARRNVSLKEKLQERLNRIPAPLLDGLLSKFTDSARGSTKYVVLPVVNARSHQEIASQSICYTGTRDNLVDTHVRSVSPGGRMGYGYNDPGRRPQYACCKSEPAVQVTWFVRFSTIHILQE